MADDPRREQLEKWRRERERLKPQRVLTSISTVRPSNGLVSSQKKLSESHRQAQRREPLNTSLSMSTKTNPSTRVAKRPASSSSSSTLSASSLVPQRISAGKAQRVGFGDQKVKQPVASTAKSSSSSSSSSVAAAAAATSVSLSAAAAAAAETSKSMVDPWEESLEEEEEDDDDDEDDENENQRDAGNIPLDLKPKRVRLSDSRRVRSHSSLGGAISGPLRVPVAESNRSLNHSHLGISSNLYPKKSAGSLKRFSTDSHWLRAAMETKANDSFSAAKDPKTPLRGASLQPMSDSLISTTRNHRTSLFQPILPLFSPPRTVPNRNFTLADFEVGPALGQGKFGHLYKAKDKSSGHIVALKMQFKFHFDNPGAMQCLRREIEVQSRLKHRNILRLFGHFNEEKCTYLILEFAPHGDLYRVLRKEKFLSEPRAAKYIVQVIQALQYCHKCGVIHRDLKPENLLLGANDCVKLADFGWSVHAIGKYKSHETHCGTPEYLSPEMVESKSYDFRIDLWSMGVLAYDLMVGMTPFYSKSQDVMYERIREVWYSFPETPQLSEDAKDFISSFLQREPDKRMRLEDALRHPWLQKNLPRE